jgi:hypothetical protein
MPITTYLLFPIQYQGNSYSSNNLPQRANYENTSNDFLIQIVEIKLATIITTHSNSKKEDNLHISSLTTKGMETQVEFRVTKRREVLKKIQINNGTTNSIIKTTNIQINTPSKCLNLKAKRKLRGTATYRKIKK